MASQHVSISTHMRKSGLGILKGTETGDYALLRTAARAKGVMAIPGRSV